MSDPELLRRYAHDGSQAAFAALVSRHLNLVYSAARRQVRSAQLAEEIAQSVFLDLARSAGALAAHQPLAAWLHTVTRRTAIDTIRRESRRAAREQAVAIDPSAMPTSATPWSQLEPLLDEAVATLPDADRHAILLRFFENKSLREIGAALGTSDDAAQKRVSRALEQLRDFFARRGLPVTTAALAADLSAHAIFTAPATLGSAITAAVLTGAAKVAAPMVATTIVAKSLVFTGAAALIGAIVYFGASRSIPPAPSSTSVAAVSPQPLPAPATPTRPTAATARVTPGSAEDLRVALLRQLIADLPAQSLPELRLLVTGDWLEVAQAHELESAADIRVALAKLRALARKKFAAHLQTALRRFTDGSGGLLPDEIMLLAPHLEAPADAEMLARYEPTRSGKLGEADEKLLREKPTSDMLLSVGLEGWHMKNNSEFAPAVGETEMDALARAAKALDAALTKEDGKPASLATELMPALTSMVEGMKDSIDRLYASVGGEEVFGAELKGAVRRFVAANPGATVTDLGQVLPFLPIADKLLAASRPMLAQVAYLVDHPGQPPPNEEQLRRYLAGSPDLGVALKVMKLQWDGEHVTFSYNFEWGGKQD